jgi:two-component system chemotaxis response regulator CheB
MAKTPQIKVMIVDDSISAQLMLKKIVESDPLLHVTGTAIDPFKAAEMMSKELPDVILMDLEMPGMDGITFIKKIMSQHPMPIVVCSGYAASGSKTAVSAINAGAVEAIMKPSISDRAELIEAGVKICDAIRAAYSAKNGTARISTSSSSKTTEQKLSPDALLPAPNANKRVEKTQPIVFIGASTGGTVALEKILTALPSDCPPILVVQHMPAGFTAAFAKRLDGLCAIKVCEATDRLKLERGMCVIAEGSKHLLLKRMSQIYQTSIMEGPLISRHRPSVDVLFRSAAHSAGRNALGIILTGMGDDGALCMREMRDCGATTIAQDEASSVVFGMPRKAIEFGGAQQILSLGEIANAILEFDRKMC